MNHNFENASNIFVLGAGASVDYGLPTWNELGTQIRERINNDKSERYQYKKEMLDWVAKVGPEMKYSTIDECITKESVSKEYEQNGHEVENQIFQIMKDIFIEAYKPNDSGWIRKLNGKILHSKISFVKSLGFINYNYDAVLDNNFLDFTYLPAKHRLLNFKPSLVQLSTINIDALHPHGYLFTDSELGSSHIYRFKETMKSSTPGLIDAVSCYESHPHSISNYSREANLYILGLGGGLQVNLDNIHFAPRVDEIHVTIRDYAKRDDITKYLSKKFEVPLAKVLVYDSCDELVEKCF